MRSPIRWFGGKGKFVKKLLPFVPECKTYVEPFSGGASLLFAKEPGKVEVYNDLDSGLINFYRTLRDPKKFKKFYKQIQLVPYSREEYYYAKKHWETTTDSIEKTIMWFVLCRQSFSGIFNHGWSYAITRSRKHMSGNVSKWLTAIQNLPEIHKRLQRIQIEHNDFRTILKTYDTKETFFYLDPPYVSSTRRAGGYKHELTDQDHKELVELLLKLKGKFMLSCYWSKIYKPLLKLKNCVRKNFDVACHVAGKTKVTRLQGKGSCKEKQKRVETIIMNYKLDTNSKRKRIF